MITRLVYLFYMIELEVHTLSAADECSIQQYNGAYKSQNRSDGKSEREREREKDQLHTHIKKYTRVYTRGLENVRASTT